MPAAGPTKARANKGKTPRVPPSPPVEKRGRRLRSIANVRAGLAWVWRGIESGTLDLAKARVITYTASVLLAALEKGELEQRIATLEARAQETER